MGDSWRGEGNRVARVANMFSTAVARGKTSIIDLYLQVTHWAFGCICCTNCCRLLKVISTILGSGILQQSSRPTLVCIDLVVALRSQGNVHSIKHWQIYSWSLIIFWLGRHGCFCRNNVTSRSFPVRHGVANIFHYRGLVRSRVTGHNFVALMVYYIFSGILV